MTMTMPDPGQDLHVASLDYACTFSQLPPGGGRVTFSCPDPEHFTFSFETGIAEVSPGRFQVSWDYSWFNQAAVEDAVFAALGVIVQALAVMLSLDVFQVRQAVAVRRVWTYAPNMQGPGVSSGRIVTTQDILYPGPVGTETAAGADGGEAVSAVLLPGCLPLPRRLR